MEKSSLLKEVPNINSIKLKKVKLKMDINLLDCIIAFIYKPSVLRTRKALSNTYKLFNNLDDRVYDDFPALKARVWVIRNSLEAMLKHDLENSSMVIEYCRSAEGSDPLTDEVLDNVDKLKISHDETRWLIKAIDDRLSYGYVMTLKEIFQEYFDIIDRGDFKSYKHVSQMLYELASSVISIKRNTNSLDSDMTFSLRNEYFENVITESSNKLRDKNRVFITGIRRLNTILSPGYQSKRLYTYLAFPGGGKSQILLKAALDIKKYNAGVEAKDPNKTPAVLLITMENDIDETVERIFNMRVSSEDIRNYTPKQVIKKLRNEGELVLTDKNNIDIIIKYYPNRSIDTNDLYGIIKDLYDDGTEVIALILDYLKRIKPAERGFNEKEELKNITNELKTLAKKLDIPVISAQQLNRTMSGVIDAALQNNKEDVTRLVGRDGVAGAWEINTMVSPYRKIRKNNFSFAGMLYKLITTKLW